MRELEDRRMALEAELENAVAPALRLHPNLAIVYREKVVSLTAVLTASGGAAGMDLVRGLVSYGRN